MFQYLFSMILLLIAVVVLPRFSLAQVIAVDGVSGFVGSSFLNDLKGHEHLRVSCHDCAEKPLGNFEYFKGSNFDPQDLAPFLKGADVFFQIGAIASVEPRCSLRTYLLTNAISGYLASRVNQSMTLVSISSMAATDVNITADLESSIQRFVGRF